MIFFIGEGPSSKNKSKDVPFVGTQSYKRLLEWIWALDVDVTEVVLANVEHIKIYSTGSVAVEQPNMMADYDFRYDSMIALGLKVSKELDNLGVGHYILPHPSSRNRKLNDPEYEVQVIDNCRIWLEGGKSDAS